MIWLVLGVLLWSGVHFIPSLGIALRTRLVTSWGELRYKLAFALVVVLSIALMAIGWRSTPSVDVYTPSEAIKPIASLLILVGFILFGAGKHDTVIKRYLRHPQLSGVVVWAIAHLLANGDSRSIILFGGLGLWALIEMPLINRREGAWVKPEAPGMKAEIKGLAISLAIFAIALLMHQYYTGVSPIPRGGAAA